MSKYVSVGKILNFHGIKGEAKVGFSKNRQDFFMSLEKVFIKDDNRYNEFEISSVRPNKNFLIVKFKGINSINDIIPLKGQILFVEESTIRDNLDEDEFLIDELVGMGVINKETGESLGFVIGVSNNGATDLLSVKTHTKHICLIPFVKAIVPDVDIKNKKIYINNIEGLLE
ncbi:MAG: ribosome maturation factor RimM [Cyanobacteriota bacterium]|nr:ribosome maturation factor RimM [Cyanobacteriota bacterium]MDY6357934.1 ribosome maturation factor RimM [Cyanobacteriota bacterium]MDY6363738.1 ribosome maturation factor RimM [Cyanobacteriota bacterium]MDY6382430.1 ribosome maturation factor RimM [Cyanobacteriota bacterium]